MQLMTTPPERFEAVPGFDHLAVRSVVDGVGIAHVDVGEGPTVLLMHGEPSWSFLYRTMIPVLVEGGFRVLAPDLVGFGRSDKPTRVGDHTYQRHVDWMLGWLRSVDPDGVTLFCQDWGGLIGLRLAAAEPDRFARIAVANTGMPTGDQRMPEAFLKWQRYAREVEEFRPGPIVAGGCVRDLEDEVVAAYDAPFPDDRYLAGPRAMPGLVPTSPDDPAAEPNREAWQVLMRWEKPVITMFSDSDPVTAGGERVFHKLVPGTAGQPHTTIEQAGHFLQEDAGPTIARALVDWM